VIRYRTFRNTDPPALAEIWRARNLERGLMQPMSAELFEQLVLSKPYFDSQGLIVAVDGERAVGFVHAAFGPNDDESDLSTQLGVTCMVMVRPDYRRLGIGSELIARSEQYLRSRGSQVLYGGGIKPLNPFYLGLYGGSELPGVLESDVEAQSLYKACGYREIDRAIVLHLDLSSFRAAVNRQQIQNRRRAIIKVVDDPPPHTWWEACTMGSFERTRFDLLATADSKRLATAAVWSMEPLATTWGVRAVGLIEFEVDREHRREGLATYLLGDLFRQVQQQGVALIEAQTMQSNSAALGLYARLGFRQVDQGVVFRKE
jgi:ribosomal protein S18 acetylase RimI-like enzyme